MRLAVGINPYQVSVTLDDTQSGRAGSNALFYGILGYYENRQM